MNKNISLKTFVKFVAKHFGIPEGLIKPESVFTTDFGIDSLSLFGFVTDIEEEYNVEIELSDLMEISMVEGAYNILLKSTSKKSTMTKSTIGIVNVEVS